MKALIDIEIVNVSHSDRIRSKSSPYVEQPTIPVSRPSAAHARLVARISALWSPLRPA
jgi:hypothetical protein